jgi:hypothetical protein
LSLALITIAMGCCTTSLLANDGNDLDVSVRRVPFGVDGTASGDVGRLRFRGGMSLSASDDNFGGISGIIVSSDGATFLAVTDRGYWITGSLEYQSDGDVHSVDNLKIAPMLGEFGKPLGDKADADAEGLTPLTDQGLAGDVLVSFEAKHRIARYRFGKDGFDSIPTLLATPQGLKNGPRNGGLEAIVTLDESRVLAISEDMRDSNQNTRAWIVPMDKTPIERLSVKRIDPFAVTDIAQLPTGDFMTLERRFTQIGGVGMQMRLIKKSDVRQGATLDGEVVASMGMTYVIDNMEGMSARRGSNGETLLYVVSDDNFNTPLQQTLLLMYELLDSTPQN